MSAREDSFAAYILDQLRDVEGLGCRAMFGGHGLYHGATFFGIVFDARLYFKTDESSAGEYLRRGMRPFHPGERQVLKTYYEVPADVLEDRAHLAEWARCAVRCAGRREDAAAIYAPTRRRRVRVGRE